MSNDDIADRGPTEQEIEALRARLRELEQQRAPVPAPRPPVFTPVLAGVHVLIVEDSQDSREMLALLLTLRGARVTAVSTALEAIEAIDATPPDVLISDLGLPQFDGYELIRTIRGRAPERGGQTPAIALTGYGRETYRTRALSEGYQSHLVKPVEPDTLVAVVAGLLAR